MESSAAATEAAAVPLSNALAALPDRPVTSDLPLAAIVDTVTAIELAFVETGGEITPEIEAFLSQVDVALPEKIDRYRAIEERLDVLAPQWKQKGRQYQAVGLAIEKAKERLRDALKFAAKTLGRDELIGVETRYKVVTAKKKKLCVEASILAEDWKKPEMTMVPDVERIEQALLLGAEINGAWLEESVQLRSYLNRPSRR